MRVVCTRRALKGVGLLQTAWPKDWRLHETAWPKDWRLHDLRERDKGVMMISFDHRRDGVVLVT